MTNKKLYVWTTADKIALAPSTGELVVKIGDAYDTNARVLGEGIDLSKRELLKTYDIGDLRDYDYHSEAERRIYSIRRLNHHVECETREAFAVPINKKATVSEWKQTAIRTIDSIVEKVGGTPELREFVPTTWQRRAIEFVAQCFEEGKSTILLELAARFGKTGMITQLFNYSDADVMVIANYVKTVNSSFGKTVVEYFSNQMTYLDASEPNFVEKLHSERDAGRKVLVTCSLFKGAKTELAIEVLTKIDNRLIVVDEADFGAHTESNRQKVELLRQNSPLILMTGTNADRAAAAHDIESHMATTYFDMLLDSAS